LPIVIGTSNSIKLYQIKHILLWFIFSVFAASIISSSILFGIIDYPISDFRDISIFISHIRFSLMINLAIFSLLYFFISDYIDVNKIQKPIFIFLIIWLVVFLFLLKSLTGIVIFCILSVVLSFVFIKDIRNTIFRNIVRYSIILSILFLGAYIYNINTQFNDIEKVNFSELDSLTKSGNKYEHNLKLKQLSNGNYIWINVCYEEIEQEWNKVSKIPFNGKDKKGQRLKFTLIRYLTSKGLKKDAEGIAALSDKDIRNVEQIIYLLESILYILEYISFYGR
jgi:ABC-type multidrug transport system fused ATPase/permease subunit